jgi:GT2 family glycosyltransferase
MPPLRDLAIIMPTRNRPSIAAKNLLRIRKHFPGVPIYVFDDASKDAEALPAAMSSVPDCSVMRSEKRIGPAGARRRLIENAQSRWCLALDDDCYPREDFDPWPWVGMEPGPDDPVIVSFRYLRSYDGDIAPPGDLETGPSRCLMGGASLLHRASVMAVGNYNAFYIFGAEDADLSFRVWASGRQVWTDPGNFIIHDHVPAGRNLPSESYYYVRNRILFNVLSLPLWYGLPLGILQAGKRWLTQPYKLSGLGGLFAGFFVSMRHFRKRRPLTLAKFRHLQSLRA